MISRFFALSGVYALSCLILIGCQKDYNELSLTAAIQNDLKGGGGNKIRLTTVTSDFGLETFEYNEDGLLHRWNLAFGYTIVHEYDPKGFLTKAWVYFNDVLYSTVVFFYNNKGERFHEIWFDGSTNLVLDEVFYQFDNNGLPTRVESFIQDYYTVNKYSSDGSLLEWAFFFNDIPVIKAEFTFDHHHKNPFSAIPGLDFAWPFTNGAFYANKWYSTSETHTEYDENGNVTIISGQDPSKTIIEVGPQNYISMASFFDEQTSDYLTFNFSYDNCGQCVNKGNALHKRNRISALHKMLLKGQKTMSEKVKEFRHRK